MTKVKVVMRTVMLYVYLQGDKDLYLSNLKTLAEGATKIQLRQAFIETAAVETFFAWHEFKKEKEKEIKEEAELVYKTTGPNEHDQKLESGEIPEEFKHQMFYTFGDYRDLCLGKDICKDMSDVQKNIKNVFENADRGIGKRDAPKEWWEKNAKDIWEGMLCALSYDTETKELKNGVRTQVNAEKNNYKNIKFTQKSGRNGQELEAFVSRPQFIRWFEEWAEDFSRKQSYKLKKFQNECQGLKDEPYYKDDSEDIIIDFSNIKETFKHAEYCAPCTTIGVKCKNVDCNDVTDNTCDKTTVQIKQDIQNNKNPIEVHMIVNDSSSNKFEGDLNVCEGTGIFTGIKENKWTCGYVCGLDICSLKTFDGEKDDKQNILIRALFKRWIENFLEDYNKMNGKISHCMKNGEGTICINGCQKKCKCVKKWIDKKKAEWENIRNRYMKRYKGNDSDVYEVRSFLERGPFHDDVQKAIKPLTDVNIYVLQI
ncbi:hypothetical protein PFHG_05269 [Plasmodium falciparum HB3]|uniref:Duffy-binding-like domain-containing protein n=1 Tax=Plasmodium falciparum (isolate HB3) TaxID=137071 RepID=A0A0L7KKA3_PLAFX|nr:hypothetical protein PFHG_05269 [Plasmodium falciparum HB3]